jgi:1,4-dihydroxy-6-naphthoate synthase
MSNKLTLGFSPCPNDTFIFEALVNGKVDTLGLSFDVVLEDVQTLNEWAQQGRLDVSKISYGVLPKIIHDYVVLSSGGALGKGVGPLLISKEKGEGKYEVQSTKYEAGGSEFNVKNPVDRTAGFEKLKKMVSERIIAIPGENTTAHFLFSQAFPEAKNKIFLRFDEIEQWVLNGNGLGVIIHENRFTYQQKGLFKLADLGALWEQNTQLPIPLGGIVAKRTLPEGLVMKINQVIQKSLAYAWQHYPDLPEYVKCHSQEMEEDIMRQHIELYVNDFSMDMQQSGRNAILQMMSAMGNVNVDTPTIFAG